MSSIDVGNGEYVTRNFRQFLAERDLNVKFLGLAGRYLMQANFRLCGVGRSHPRFDAIEGGFLILGPGDDGEILGRTAGHARRGKAAGCRSCSR